MPTTAIGSIRDHLARQHGYTASVFVTNPLEGLIYYTLPDEMLSCFHDYIHDQARWANTDGHVHDSYPDDVDDDSPDYEK